MCVASECSLWHLRQLRSRPQGGRGVMVFAPSPLIHPCIACQMPTKRGHPSLAQCGGHHLASRRLDILYKGEGRWSALDGPPCLQYSWRLINCGPRGGTQGLELAWGSRGFGAPLVVRHRQSTCGAPLVRQGQSTHGAPLVRHRQ